MNSDAIVRARISSAVKTQAAAALSDMGLTISDAIRLMLIRVADEGRLPFDIGGAKAEIEEIREFLKTHDIDRSPAPYWKNQK